MIAPPRRAIIAAMSLEIRPYDGTFHDFMTAVLLPFAWTMKDEDEALFEPVVELDRALAAYDGDRVVATAGAFSFSVTVPGGELPMAGVTMVGVHPTHRRRGILRQLMRRQLDDVHARGEPLAGLWASEGLIYQRFGYGLATLGAGFSVDRARSAFRSPHVWSGTLRLLDRRAAEELIPPLHAAARPQRPGAFDRSAAWYASEFFHDPEHARNGGAEAAYILHETDGRPTGYARYRVKSEWDDVGAKGTVEVHELMSLTPSAHADLWRYLLDIDLVATIRGWNLPVDDPLPLLVAEPRRLSWTVRDGLWLRIVDLPAAIEGRRYAAAGRVVLEVSDEFCDWNGGRWSLETDAAGGGHAERTGDEADLALSAADLGAAYLGAFSIADLARAGRARELRAGAIAAADDLLRTDIAPWCPKVF